MPVLQHLTDAARYRHATRQARRFNAKQVHQPAYAVVQGALNDEVPGWLARPVQFGPYACITGLQRPVGKRRPVLANLFIKSLATRRVNHKVVG